MQKFDLYLEILVTEIENIINELENLIIKIDDYANIKIVSSQILEKLFEFQSAYGVQG